MSNINKLDGISAVEDLTNAAAAVVEGGTEGNFNFDSFQATKPFFVGSRQSVFFACNSSGGNFVGTNVFTASLRNTSTGRTTSPNLIRVGLGGSTSWSNVRGGNYRIDLRAREDNLSVIGTYHIAP